MLNTTQSERRRSAQKDLALKLSLEFLLIRELIPIFRSVSEEFVATYTTMGVTPSMTTFSDSLNDALNEHYAKVADKFNTRIVDELGKPDNHDDVMASINNRTGLHHDTRADQSTQSIADTTTKNMNAAIQKVKDEAETTGEDLTHEEIAQRAQLNFDQRSVGHKNTIAITETQNIAEHTKQSEIDFLDQHDSEIDGERIKPAKKEKEWVAILDNVTRDAHAIADGLIVDFDQPFNVMGEQLMYPGDTSLGASVENIINCRCSSVPIIVAAEEDDE